MRIFDLYSKVAELPDGEYFFVNKNFFSWKICVIKKDFELTKAESVYLKDVYNTITDKKTQTNLPKYLLKNKGHLNIIISASRLVELFILLDKYNIAAKVMRSVHPKPNTSASVVLVEGMRAAKKGITVFPPLFICGSDGKETFELSSAYTLEGSEKLCL